MKGLSIYLRGLFIIRRGRERQDDVNYYFFVFQEESLGLTSK